MGRYTGPKARKNRRLGVMVFESAGAIRAAERRDYPPGASQRRRKPSNYAIALREKQKIKYYYGLRERQLRKYFVAAKRMKGNTGEQLLVLCERRLDNVVRRAGLAVTRPQASMFIWTPIPEPWAEMGSIEFALKLLDEAGVACSPGRGFGEEGENFLRLAIVENSQRLRQAVRQIDRCLKTETTTTGS